MVTGRPVDDRLLDFLRGKIRQAFGLQGMVAMARQAGYSDAAIDVAIERVRPRGTSLVNGRIPAPPLVRRAPANLRNLGAPRLDLYALDGFLGPQECERLIALISRHLEPSRLSHGGDPEFRISQSALLCLLDDPLAKEIDAKICRALGISAEYSEGIQAQRYDVGGRFKPHFDYFGPGSDVHRSACSLRGNRTWTFMVYLNDAFEGGATRFTDIDCTVQPQTGMALFWNNLSPDGAPNPLTRHCGEIVTRGHKVIITKWFRLLGHGPLEIESTLPA
jgi:prolyl 4-hydroxylase